MGGGGGVEGVAVAWRRGAVAWRRGLGRTMKNIQSLPPCIEIYLGASVVVVVLQEVPKITGVAQR